MRGNWNTEDKAEDGNFIQLTKWAAKSNPILNTHIQSCARNATYLSPTIQNEFIGCLENEVREKLVAQCNQSLFFSVMADETTDCSTVEQLSICVRYLKASQQSKFEVCEEFVGFAEVKDTCASTIADTILSKLRLWGFDLSKLRGKGFDRASNMSGYISADGVQARIQTELPAAKYFTHCFSHCLNLVIVNSCRVPLIRNFMDSFKSLSYYVRSSAKRKQIHMDIFSNSTSQQKSQSFDDYSDSESVNDALKQGYKREVLPSLCETRWLARVNALSALLAKYGAVYDTLTENIFDMWFWFFRRTIVHSVNGKLWMDNCRSCRPVCFRIHLSFVIKSTIGED